MPQQLNERLLSWASILDDSARAQAITTSSMPFIQPHVALMPDAHLDVIWTRCKQVADSVRGPEATRLRALMVSCVEPTLCATVTA